MDLNGDDVLTVDQQAVGVHRILEPRRFVVAGVRGQRVVLDRPVRVHVATCDLLPIEIDDGAVVAQQSQRQSGVLRRVGDFERVPEVRGDEVVRIADFSELKVEGDFVLCDFGACFRKYNSDITRTFVFGKASEIQKEMYETVFEAQRIGFEKTKSGAKACDVHNAVESYINNTKFKGRFIHSTGHPLGLSVHDGDQRLGVNCDMELKENMVFTIEPGVYISEIGGVRIEDDILIKKDGIESLTKSSRQLIEI